MSELAIRADAAFANVFQTVLKAASAWLIVGPAMTFAAEPITDVMLSSGGGFSEQDGESLYRASCQACHMSQGEGASGASRYWVLLRVLAQKIVLPSRFDAVATTLFCPV